MIELNVVVESLRLATNTSFLVLILLGILATKLAGKIRAFTFPFLDNLAYLIELLHSPRSLLQRSMETQNERNRTRVKSGNLSLSTAHHPTHAHTYICTYVEHGVETLFEL